MQDGPDSFPLSESMEGYRIMADYSVFIPIWILMAVIVFVTVLASSGGKSRSRNRKR